MIDLAIGDIVHLNSGSPDLRVASVRGEYVTVTWDIREGISASHLFPRVCLTSDSSTQNYQEKLAPKPAEDVNGNS